MSTVPSREIADAYEETVAIEHLCKLVEKNLLKPARCRDIAHAMICRDIEDGYANQVMQEALRTPGQHMKERGLRAAVKAVRAKS